MSNVRLPLSPARRQRNVTGLWREMRAEAICWSTQKNERPPRRTHFSYRACFCAKTAAYCAVAVPGGASWRLSIQWGGRQTLPSKWKMLERA